MADPEDLLGKADALMARHRPGRTPGASYPEIPVLEEVVDLPPQDDDVPLLTDVVESGGSVLMPLDQALLREEQVAALSQSRRASLLESLAAEIDARIEERLKERLEPIVEKLFENLRDELQMVARDTLAAALDEAMKRDLERHRP
jgi:hypothetical protein